MAISYIQALVFRKPRLVTAGHFLVKTNFYTHNFTVCYTKYFLPKKRRWLNLDKSGKIEVKSPSVRRLSKLYLPLTHAIPLEIRHAGKQAILTQSR